MNPLDVQNHSAERAEVTSGTPAERRSHGGERSAPAPAADSGPNGGARATTGHTVTLRDLHAFYGEQHAVKGVDLAFPAGEATAIIGPSGCGKSTMVRCINRMHEEIPGARATGSVQLDELDIYADGVDVTAVRRLIGMVFQKPNPFPTMSIFDNVAAGLRLTGTRGDDLRERVHRALRAVGLWNEVKSRLGEPGIGLSGGQQQRLCIARTIAVEPEVILMDEPCSALDPVATLKIEELIDELKARFTIVIVTHNMQQAARVADTTAFLLGGELIEHGPTNTIFTTPGDERTERYVTGKFGVDRVALQETRHAFRESLKELEKQTLGGLEIVVTQLDRSLRAIADKDIELASLVIADDDRIDGRYLEVHQGVLSLLARQAPVAGDLRIVAAMLHIIRCMERMGDQCVNIAKLVPLAGYEAPTDGEILAALEQMGQAARKQVVRCQQAFARRDVELARELARDDEEINRVNRQIFRRAVDIGDDPELREWAMLMILVARALERIGDNTVDVAEQVVFVVTGLFREMADASDPGGSPPARTP